MSDELNQNRDENGCCEITPQMLQARERWDLESDSHTFYIYYELKSIADILEQWAIFPSAGSVLEYALKARDRFLAHPEFCRIGPRSNRSAGYRHLRSLTANDDCDCDRFASTGGRRIPVAMPTYRDLSVRIQSRCVTR